MFRILILIVVISFIFIFPFDVRSEETLTWQDCVKETAKNNPDLISAQENIKQESAAKNITASGLYPQVDASADAFRAKANSSVSNNFSYGVSASQLVFDGFKTINNVKSASEDIKASQESYRFISSEVRLNLRTAFVSLLRAQQLIKVAEDILNIRKDNLMLITLRYESGLEHRGALLTAEANLAEAEFELSQANREVELAQRQLTKEMGRKEFVPMSVQEDFVVRDEARDKPNFDDIVKNNPSLLQAIAKKNSAAYNIKSAYGNFAPEISGSAGADRSGSRWPPDTNQWNAGLRVSLPIFEGGLRIAELAQAKAIYNQAAENERSVRDAAIVNLEQAWVSLQDAVETVGVQRKLLDATEERSRIAESQFSTGFITFDNWIIIENDLVSAKKAYLNSQANSLLAEANWIQAKGEILEYAQK